MKTATAIGREFNALPGHVKIAGYGSGSSDRIAVARAVSALMRDRKLRGRRSLHSFTVDVVLGRVSGGKDTR